MLLKRQKKIIQYLYNKKSWVTANELAKVFDVSSRTIRTDILGIKDSLKDDNISSSKIQGYCLNMEETDYLNLMSENNISYPTERTMYILKKLIVYEKGINLFDLAYELFVSESTLLSDINQLKNTIENTKIFDYQIKKDGEILYLEGDKTKKDKLFVEMVRNLSPNIDREDLNKIFSDFDVIKVMDLIINTLQSLNYTSRYVSLIDLVLYISLILQRSILNVNICNSSIDMDIISLKEYNIAFEIIEKIRINFKTNIPDDEILFLAYNISGATELDLQEKKIKESNIESDPLYSVICDIFNEIHKEFFIDFTLDHDMKKDLTIHAKLALMRTEIGIRINNPLKEYMRNEYPFLFDIAIFLSKRLYDHVGILLNQEEISFFVAYLGVSLEKIKKVAFLKNKLTILLIIFEGKATLNHISRKILNIFPSQDIEIYSISSVYEIEKLKGFPLSFDIFVSTSKVTMLPFKEDLIIHPSFNIVDEFNIRNIINLKLSDLKLLNFEAMFSHFFNSNFFITNLNAESKEDALNYLCEDLKNKNFVDDSYIESVFERENLISTALNTGIALPHSTNVRALKTIIYVAILKKPINWCGNKVKAILLFSIDSEDIYRLSIIYEYIVKLATIQSNVDDLYKCKDFCEFKDLLYKAYL